MLPDPFDNMAVPKALATEFFAVFSRCEYAMKETVYRRNERGQVAAAWWQLGDAAVGWLVVPAGSNLAAAIELLTSPPPKVQTFDEGWQVRQLRDAPPIAQAVEAATRVRNNLFHGGKNGRVEREPGRDERLVRAALTLLIAVIESCPEELSAFYING